MVRSTIFSLIREDMACNSHAKSKFILAFYRVAFASGASTSPIVRMITKPIRLIYRVIIDWIMGVDIPTTVRIGRRPILYHSMALVINEAVIIGDDCILRHSVTIGNKLTKDGESTSPIIGDKVEFGAGAIILGPIIIGDNAKIGAGSVVTKSVPPGAIIVGNPGRNIQTDVYVRER
jgi:serine acetyltransferase